MLASTSWGSPSRFESKTMSSRDARMLQISAREGFLRKWLVTILGRLLYTFYRWPRLRKAGVTFIERLGFYQHLLPMYVKFIGSYHASGLEEGYLLRASGHIKPIAVNRVLSTDELLARIDIELSGAGPQRNGSDPGSQF